MLTTKDMWLVCRRATSQTIEMTLAMSLPDYACHLKARVPAHRTSVVIKSSQSQMNDLSAIAPFSKICSVKEEMDMVCDRRDGTVKVVWQGYTRRREAATLCIQDGHVQIASRDIGPKAFMTL